LSCGEFAGFLLHTHFLEAEISASICLCACVLVVSCFATVDFN
jgi:hypothetical protein